MQILSSAPQKAISASEHLSIITGLARANNWGGQTAVPSIRTSVYLEEPRERISGGTDKV